MQLLAYLGKSIVDNGKSVAVVSGLLATEREAITTKTTNKKSTMDNFQPRITATQCCTLFFCLTYK